jgi:hypothetical protein
MALAVRQKHHRLAAFPSISPAVHLSRRLISLTSRLQSERHDVPSSKGQSPPDRTPASQTTRTATQFPRPKKSPLRVWPFVFIVAGGTWMFHSLIKSREGKVPAKPSSPIRPF